MKVSDAFNLRIIDYFGRIDHDDVNFDFEQLDNEDETNWGVSKFVIFPADEPDKVIKIPFEGNWEWNEEIEENDWLPFEVIVDYCAEEEEVYSEAVDAGIECFFAETRFGGCTKDGTRFYVSERVIPYSPTAASEDSTLKARKIEAPLDSDWLANAIDFYGIDKVAKLVKFLDDRGLFDFHRGNLGMRKDGSPVLLDYSDFREDW